MHHSTRNSFALKTLSAFRHKQPSGLCHRLLYALLLNLLLLAAPVTAISGEYDTPFWRCFDQYCTPHKDACYATLCVTSKSGCAAPCGIFDNRGGPCPRVCSSIGTLYENHECNIQYRDFATACMSGCVQPDSPKAFDCAWKCKSKADSLRKQCWVLVNEQQVKPEDAVKQIYPARNRGQSVASGDRYIMHNGKIFVINEAKWKRRVQRDLPPELGTFYTDEFDPLRMDWAADSTVLLTGLGTGAAVAVGVMSGGSAIIIGAGVTFVASTLKTFVSESADTMDTGKALKSGLKDGAWDATVGVGIDVATGGAAGVAKGAIKSVVKNSAKAVTRRVGKETLKKAIAPVSKTPIGKVTSKLIQKTFNTKYTWLNPEMKSATRVMRSYVYRNNKKQFYVTLSRGDAIMDGMEAGLSNLTSNWLNNTTRQGFDLLVDQYGNPIQPTEIDPAMGYSGDTASGIVLRNEVGTE